MGYTPSKYQLAIYEKYRNSDSNIFIKAGPGSGKTHTLLQLLKQTPFYKKCVMMAFNKSIADEMKERVPRGTQVGTMHSIAYRILRKCEPQNYKLNEIKAFILSKNVVPPRFRGKPNEQKKQNAYLFTISRMYDLYRMNLSDLDIESLRELAHCYSVECNDMCLKDAVSVIGHIEEYDKRGFGGKEMMIDYTDMLWLPYRSIDKGGFPKYDIVMIDEVQDLNPLQRECMMRLVDNGGRFIAVGDEKQAIYSFMGSNLDSFNALQGYPNTVTMPLSVSYRCPKIVVEWANDVFPGLEPHEGSDDGDIRIGSMEEASPGDIMICRNNQPLVEAFLSLLGMGKRCRILGRDLEKSLFNMIDSVDDVEQLQGLKFKKLEHLKEKGVASPLSHKSFLDLCEKIDIIRILMDHFGCNMASLKSRLHDMFTGNKDDGIITLMTGHKSKGLEADRVFWLHPHLIPSEHARTELEMYQERCLSYVIITRAKKELVIIK